MSCSAPGTGDHTKPPGKTDVQGQTPEAQHTYYFQRDSAPTIQKHMCFTLCLAWLPPFPTVFWPWAFGLGRLSGCELLLLVTRRDCPRQTHPIHRLGSHRSHGLAAEVSPAANYTGVTVRLASIAALAACTTYSCTAPRLAARTFSVLRFVSTKTTTTVANCQHSAVSW